MNDEEQEQKMSNADTPPVSVLPSGEENKTARETVVSILESFKQSYNGQNKEVIEDAK